MQIYNLGNTHPHTVTEMVDLLEAHLRRPAGRRYVPVPPTGDVLATFADITAARKVRRRGHCRSCTSASAVSSCTQGQYPVVSQLVTVQLLKMRSDMLVLLG